MIKLPPGEAVARHIARNKAKNEKRKSDLKAYKLANGILQKTPEEKKARMREYIRAIRAKEKALKPPRPVKTAEERRLHVNAKQRRAYTRKLAKEGKAPKQRIYTIKPKPIKMQQPLKQTPLKAVFHKPDHFKQPVLKMKNNSTAGKIKLIIKPGFEIYVSPGKDIEQVRQRYLNR